MATTQTYGCTVNLGTYTGWKPVDGTNPSSTLQVGVALDESGNEAASQTFQDQTEYSASYECNNDTNTVPATMGTLVNSLCILLNLTISTSNTSCAKLTMSGHNHTEEPHDGTLKQAAHGITVAKWWGATDFLEGTGGEGATVLSGTVSITCGHNDSWDGAGMHAAGENSHGVIEATTVWQGSVTTPAGAGWTITKPIETAVSNTGVLTTTVMARKAFSVITPV